MKNAYIYIYINIIIIIISISYRVRNAFPFLTVVNLFKSDLIWYLEKLLYELIGQRLSDENYFFVHRLWN